MAKTCSICCPSPSQIRASCQRPGKGWNWSCRDTRRYGCSWIERSKGLPGPEAYLTIYRQAFGTAGEGDELQLYFGATSGDVFGSADAGASWFSAHERLAPVTSVRVA